MRQQPLRAIALDDVHHGVVGVHDIFVDGRVRLLARCRDDGLDQLLERVEVRWGDRQVIDRVGFVLHDVSWYIGAVAPNVVERAAVTAGRKTVIPAGDE